MNSNIDSNQTLCNTVFFTAAIDQYYNNQHAICWLKYGLEVDQANSADTLLRASLNP